MTYPVTAAAIIIKKDGGADAVARAAMNVRNSRSGSGSAATTAPSTAKVETGAGPVRLSRDRGLEREVRSPVRPGRGQLG